MQSLDRDTFGVLLRQISCVIEHPSLLRVEAAALRLVSKIIQMRVDECRQIGQCIATIQHLRAHVAGAAVISVAEAHIARVPRMRELRMMRTAAMMELLVPGLRRVGRSGLLCLAWKCPWDEYLTLRPAETYFKRAKLPDAIVFRHDKLPDAATRRRDEVARQKRGRNNLLVARSHRPRHPVLEKSH